MEPQHHHLQSGDKCWLGLAAYVVGVNVLAAVRGTEMLSEAADRYLIRWRWGTELAMAAVYCHVSNRVPDRYDPIHWAFLGVRWVANQLLSKGDTP